MKKKAVKIILLLSLLIQLTGCYDYKEPDEIAYIVAVGVDKGDTQNAYNFTIQFARPSKITGGGGEEGGSGEETTGIVNVDAPSLYTAINLANHVVSKKFTLSHTKVIVLSDDLCKESITPMIDSIGRSSDIRPSVYICVANGKAYDYLKAVKPSIEINPVKYYQLILESDYTSYIPVNDAQEIYFNFKNNLKQNVLPLVGASEGTQKEEGQKQGESGGGEGASGGSSGSGQSGSGGDMSTMGQDSSTQGGGQSGGSEASGMESSQKEKNIPENDEGFEYRMKEYIAGNLDIKKQNAGETIGGAVFKKDKMIGQITGIEAEIYNILCGKFNEGYAVMSSSKVPDGVITIRLEQKERPRTDVDIEDEKIIVRTRIYMEGDFISTPQDSVIEEDILSFEEESEKYIKDALMKFLKKTQEEFNSDIIGYGNYAKRVFLTDKSFYEFGWNDKYNTAEFDIDVEFNIRRTGLISKKTEGK